MIDPRHRNTALLVSGCFFMEMLDGTIVTTAIPQMSRSLHARPAAVGLVITAYLLTLAVLIPLSGWLTRRYGNRAVFLTAIAIFTLASVGCAVSVSLPELVAMRVLQGAGGAMMVPVGRTMVVSMADKEDLLRITSYVVWPGLLAPVIAPLAGGLITTYASWHWMFIINVPLGIVAFAAASHLVRDGDRGAAPPPLDWAGVLLTCAGLGGLTYAAHLVSLPAPPAAQTAAVAAASAALLAGAVRHLRRAAHPLLNLRTLRVPTFRVSQFGGTAYWFVVGAAPFLLPLLFQTQFGWSPVKSGAVTAFIFVGNVGIKPFTTPLINRFGFRWLLVVSTVGTAVVMIALGFTTAATPLPVIAALTLVSGITRSTGLTVYSTVGLADMAPELMRDANTLYAMSMQLGAGLAIAAATVALRLGGLFPGGTGLGGYGKTAYTVAFCLLALIAVGNLAEALRMDQRAGDSARRPPVAAASAQTSPVPPQTLGARHHPDDDQAGYHGHDSGDEQPRERVAEVERPADTEPGADHDGRVVTVDVEQARLPEPVVVPVGRRPGLGRRPGSDAADGQPAAALAAAQHDCQQEGEASGERQHRQGARDSRGPVDVPGPQRGEQQGQVHEGGQRQHGLRHGGKERAVAARGCLGVGGVDVRPGAVDEQRQPGPQCGDVDLAAHGGEDLDGRLVQVRVAEHADDHARRDDRQGRRQPAHRVTGRAGAPACVGGHHLPVSGEPLFGGLGGGDPRPSPPEAPEVGGHLNQQNDPGQPPRPVSPEREGRGGAGDGDRRGPPIVSAPLAHDDRG